MNKFKQEEKDFLQYYFDTDAFPLPNKPHLMHINKHAIELIIRPNCNQTCEYCYIYKYGKDLYPKYNISNKEILENFDAFLDFYFIQRKNWSYLIEFFAGDLFYDDLFFDLINILEKYLLKIKADYPYILEEHQTSIVIPCNMSFVVEKPKAVEKFKKIHNYFLEDFNTKIAFSWSTDGIYGTYERERKELKQEYFDKIFDFCFEMNAGYHPMTSASNVHVLKENYDWWLENISKRMKEYGTEIWEADFAPSMLEVRNGSEWTDNDIDVYLDFLKYAMKIRYELCHSSVEMLARHFFGDPNDFPKYKLPRLCNYDHLALNYHDTNDNPMIENIGCNLQSSLHINLVDFSMVPCHRTSYPLFTGCYFIKNNNGKIIDFKPHNVSGYYTIKTAHAYRMPVCSICDYNPVCVKGCLGAQFEETGEILMPIPSICNLYKRKADYLIKLYNDYGIIEKAFELKLIQNEKQKEWLIKKSKELGYELK